MSVPFLNITVDPTNVLETVKGVARRVRPNWREEDIVFEDISSGYINKNFKISVKNKNDAFVVRLINTTFDSTFMKRYKQVSMFLHETELSPKLLAEIENGLCIEFVYGTPLSWKKQARLYEEDIWKKVSETMARYHSENVFAKATSLLREEFEKLNPERNMEVSALFDVVKANEALSADYRRKVPSTAEWAEGWQWHLTYLKQIRATLAFCHMDVNASNIILSDGKAVLIDFDVTGIQYLSIDIAWYFLCHCNFLGTHFSLNQYPSLDFQLKWLQHYLTYRHKMDGYVYRFPSLHKDKKKETPKDGISIENAAKSLQREVDIGRLGAYMQATYAAAIIITLTQKGGDDALDPVLLIDCWDAFKALRAELEKSGPHLD